MPYLMDHLGLTTFEPLSRTLLARGGGIGVGAVVGGLLCACCVRVRPGTSGAGPRGSLDLVMVIGLMIGAMAVALISWCPDLIWMSGIVGGEGVARGILSIGEFPFSILTLFH